MSSRIFETLGAEDTFKYRYFFPSSVTGIFSPEKLRCALVQVPGQVQRGSGEGSEGSGEGLGGFGAEPGQVQQSSGEGSGEGLGGFGAEPLG